VDAISPVERSVVVTDNGQLVLAGGTLRSRPRRAGREREQLRAAFQVFNGSTRWDTSAC